MIDRIEGTSDDLFEWWMSAGGRKISKRYLDERNGGPRASSQAASVPIPAKVPSKRCVTVQPTRS